MAAEAQNLTEAEVVEQLVDLPGWQGDAAQIEATYEMATFPVAIDLVDHVARAAEEASHHPDIDIRWRRVTFRLTTHDVGGVTSKDVALAGRIHTHARGLGWTAS